MSAWIAVALAGLASYACRVVATLLLEGRTLPPWFDRASRYVMPATFAGLVAPAVIDPVRAGEPLAWPLTIAASVTVLTARRSPPQLAMFMGMGSLWISHALVVRLGLTGVS